MKPKYIVCLLLVPALAGVLRAEPQQQYFAVFLEGAKVGYAIHNRAVEGGRVTTSQTVNVSMSRMGVEISVTTTETSIETTGGKPLGFVVEQNLGAMSMKSAGTVSRDGTVTVTAHSMGTVQTSSFTWPEPAVMMEGLRLLMLRKGLKAGTSYSVKVFSPSMGRAVDAQIRIGPKENIDILGRVVNLTKVETVMSMPGMGEIVTTNYVDDELNELKSTTPALGMMLELIACPKAVALGANDVFDAFAKTFVASPEPLGDVSKAKTIAYYLKPAVGVKNLVLPESDNQRVKQLEDGSVIVAVEPAISKRSGRYPYRGADKELLEALRPTPYLQSDNKKIIELAKRAVRGAKDARQAARQIEAFVADYIENKDLSVGFASAAEVVESRQGDCSEHAVLTAAMCRAAGIPARVVVGIAYVEDFAGLQGFGPHAWDEAYVGDIWIGLDATFRGTGRGGFDAGHIALATGSGEPESFFNLVTNLGQFKITKVMVNRGQ